MADDIRLAGVRFVAEDYRHFRSTLRNANDDIRQLNKNLNTLKSDSSLLNTRLGGASTGVRNLGTSLRSSRRDLLSWASDLSVVRYGIEALINDLLRAGQVVIGIPASYESAFAGVAKTVDGLAEVSDEGFLQLTEAGDDLKEGLKDLSEVIPSTFEELSRYAELGGQLNILESAKDAEEASTILLNFTETIAGLNEATDIVGDDAALKLSQIVNLYRDSVEDVSTVFGDLGNVIVGLGNDTATTESQILNISRRIANAGNVVGLQIDEILSLGAAISSTGITAEAGGTAISNGLLILNAALSGSGEIIKDNSEEIAEYENKILDLNAKLVRLEYQTGESGQSLIDQKNAFIEAGGSVEDFGRTLGVARRQQLFRTQEEINNLTAELTKLRDENGQTVQVTEDALQIFADTAGLSVEAFRELAETDTSEALILFIEGLNRVDESGGDVVAVLNKLGIGSAQAERTFISLAKSSDELRRIIALGNDEFENGSALVDEIEKRYATLDSQFVIFQNTLRNTVDDIFYGLIPTLVNVLDVSSDVIDIIGKRVPDSLRLLKAALEPLQQIDIGIEVDPVDLTTLGFDNLDEFLKGLDIQPFVDFVLSVQTLSTITLDDIRGSLSELDSSLDRLKGTESVQELLDSIERLREQVSIELDFGALLSSVATFPIDTLTSTINLITDVILLIEALNNQDTQGFNEALDNIATGLQEKLLRPFETLDIIFPEFQLTEKIQAFFDSFEVPEIDLSIPITPLFDFDESTIDRLKDTDFGALLSSVVTFPTDTLTNTIALITDVISLMEALNNQDTKGFNEALDDIATGLQEKLLRPLETLDIAIPELQLTEKIQAFFDSFEVPEIDLSIPVTPLFDFEFDESTIEAYTELNEALSPFVKDTLPAFIDNLSELSNNIFTLDNLNSSIQAIKDTGVPQSFIDGLNLLAEISLDELRVGIQILDGLNDVLQGLNENNTALQESGALKIGDAIVEGIGSPLESLFRSEGIETDVITPLNELRESITLLHQALQGLPELELQEVETEGTLLGDQFIANLLPAAIEQLTATTDVLTAFINVTNSEDITTAGTNLKTLAEALAEFFVVGEDISRLSQSVSEAETFAEKIQSILNTITGAGVPPIDVDADSIINFPTTEEIDAWFAQNVDPIKLELSSLVNLPTKEDIDAIVFGLALDLSTGLLDAIATTQNLKARILTIADLIEPPTQQQWLDWATSLATSLAGAIQDALNTITDPASLDVSKFIEITGIEDFVNGLRNALAEISLFGVTPFESFAAPEVEDPDLSTAIEKFGEAPQLMADSYEQGLDNADKSFVDRTTETGEKIKNAILSALGFSSPSEFFISIGKQIIESIAIGLSDLAPINEAFTTALADDVIPTTLEWDETNIQVAETLISTVVPSVETTMQVIEELIYTMEAAEGTTRSWASSFTSILIPALKDTQTQLNLIETKSEEIVEVIDLLTESYLALAAAITAANNAGSVSIPSPGAGTSPTPPGGATPFAIGGSFIVPSAIPTRLRGATGGMNIEVHPGEYVQVVPRSITKMIERIPTNIPSPIQQMQMPQISNQTITNTNTNNSAVNNQELHLHIQEAPSANVYDSFELMKILSGR